jgi:hypothetical protein
MYIHWLHIHILLIHLSTDEQLDYFQLLTFVNYAAVSVGTQYLFGSLLSDAGDCWII